MKINDAMFYLVFIPALAGLMCAYLIFTGQATKIQVVPELCEVGTVHPDGSVTLTEDSAGTYDYTIFTTTSGIKVLGECK